MQFKLQWRRRGSKTFGEPQTRHRDFLRRLQRVPYYGSAERRRQLESGSLEALAPVALAEYLERRALFSTNAGRSAAAPFEYPMSPSPRTAVLYGGFRSGGSVRIFPEGWSDAARRFSPEAIAAPVAALNRLALAVLAGSETVPRLHHAAVALVALGEPLPRDGDRDLWWRAFGVPAFEYVVGPAGGALAMECEAREGLHVVRERAVFEMENGELLVTPLASSVARLRSGWTCELTSGVCPCGRDGARLLDLQPLTACELTAQAC
ncbi:MAG: hypothetical protein ACRD9L_07040 [Bryobacteraceae bacterium]